MRPCGANFRRLRQSGEADRGRVARRDIRYLTRVARDGIERPPWTGDVTARVREAPRPAAGGHQAGPRFAIWSSLERRCRWHDRVDQTRLSHRARRANNELLTPDGLRHRHCPADLRCAGRRACRSRREDAPGNVRGDSGGRASPSARHSG